MNTRNRVRIVGVIALVMLVLGGCKKPKEGCLDPKASNYDPTAKYNSLCIYADDSEPKDTAYVPCDTCVSDPNFEAVQIHIIPKIDGKRMFLNRNYEDDSSRDFQITLFKYFVSNVKFTARSGIKKDVADIELIDYDTTTYFSATRPIYDHIIEGTVEAGLYSAIYFGCGVDPIWNEEYKPNNYPSDHPLNVTYTNMDWSWEAKYKFTSIGGNIDSDGDAKYDRAFFMHTGFSEMYRQVILNPTNDIEVKEGMTTVVNLELDILEVFKGLNIATKEGQTHSSGAEQMEYSRAIQTNLANSIKFIDITYISK